MRSLSTLFILVVVATGLVAGCKSSSPRPPANGQRFTFIIKPGSGLEQAEFPVDVFLVGEETAKQVAAVKVDDYFKPDNSIRELVKSSDTNTYLSFSFSPSSSEPVSFTLTKKTRFPNYTKLVVLAKIPVEISDGSTDPRRRFLPLAPENWSPNARQVTLTITSGGIRSDPEPVENP